MLAARVATGLSLVALFLVVLVFDEWLAPWYPFWMAAVIVAMLLAAGELVELLGRTSAKPAGGVVIGSCVLMILANWLPHVSSTFLPTGGHPGEVPYDPLGPIHVMAWPMWAFTMVVMFSFVAQSAQFEKPGGTMAAISGTLLAVAYVGLLGSFIIQLRWLDGKHHGLIPLVYLVATAKGGDAGAYTFGRIAGRRKLWPRLSPNKTVEGALGGMASGVVAALIVTVVARYILGAEHLDWGHSVGFGVLVGAAAQLGDLMESMIKRDCSRKDASATLPGFGGILDVLDSLLFAGPAAYGYWVWFGV